MIIKKIDNNIIFYNQDIDLDVNKVINDEVLNSDQKSNIEIINKTEWIKKHFIRKGFMSFLGDKYVRPLFGLKATRSYAEFCILNFLYNRNFNTCKPIMGWVTYQNMLIYEASLIVERLKDTVTLSEYMRNNVKLNFEELFAKVGQQIALMHSLGVYHGDLNAHNILVKVNTESSNKLSHTSIETSDIFIIDFDKSIILRNKTLFSILMRRNISRLKRSLIKLGYKDQTDKYWKLLLQAYSLT